MTRDRQSDSEAVPRFQDITEPRMVCLYTGNGSGTKLFQGFLDDHPQILMVPGYPLMYLYPHWDEWRAEYGANFDWPTAVDLLCDRHASILDARELPGHDGLTTLGESRDQAVQIDAERFRRTLLALLRSEAVHVRTFILAIHYAYGLCRDADLKTKKALIFHIHVPDYVPQYLAVDFPDMLTLGFVRDPRSNIKGRYESSSVAVDAHKLNATDARIYLRRTYFFVSKYLLDGLQVLDNLPAENCRVIRHEDLYFQPEETVDKAIEYLGLDFAPTQRTCTFGGLAWWGDPIYKMAPSNVANPRIVSLDWQKWLPVMDWFVLEGVFFDYCTRYGYPLYRYKADTAWNRFLLSLAILMPCTVERRIFAEYWCPSIFVAFVKASVDEGFGRIPLKDYSTNAYYRHKWSNCGLDLWRPRWFVRLLNTAHRAGQPLLKWSAGAVYVAANIGRYLAAIPVHCYWMARRAAFNFYVVKHRIRGESILPETIPDRLKGVFMSEGNADH